MIIDVLTLVIVITVAIVVSAFFYEPHGARNNPDQMKRPDVPPAKPKQFPDGKTDKTALRLAEGLRREGRRIVIEIHSNGTYEIKEP